LAEGISEEDELDKTLSQIDFSILTASLSTPSASTSLPSTSTASPRFASPSLASTPTTTKFRADWLEQERERVEREIKEARIKMRQGEEKLRKWHNNVK
jgi:hypothetical protein